VYSGGYSNKRSPARIADYDDASIIQESLRGNTKEARPIFGCANGSKMRKEIDPPGLKY
jgi:hypothetical protein